MRAKIIRHVNNQNSNPYIPHELFATEILTRLPDVKTLLRFKSVSKQWYNTISSHKVRILLNDECFNQNHSFLLLQSNNVDNKLFLFDYDDHGNSKSSVVRPPQYASNSNNNTGSPKRPIRLVSSSGGLVCCISAYNALYFWNPTTRACREIVFPEEFVYLQSPPDSYPLWAFGYLPSIDDYKFLYVENIWKTAYTYTLRSANGWRKIDVANVVDSYRNNSVSTGVLLSNGNTHWLIAKELEDGYYFCILVYDFIDETFSEIALPKLYAGPYSCAKKCSEELYHTYIGDVEHELCLCHRDCESDQSWYLDLWVMKEYGKIETWSKMYKVETRNEVKWIFDCSNSCKFRAQGKVFNLTSEFLYWGNDDDEYIAGYVDDGSNDQKLPLYVGVANNTSDDECFDINHVQIYVPKSCFTFSVIVNKSHERFIAYHYSSVAHILFDQCMTN